MKFKSTILEEVKDTKLLLKNVPVGVFMMLVISVVFMNLLANKEISTGVSWLALDSGILLSGITFLCMDMLTKRFGPKAAIKLSVVAVGVNLFVVVVLKIASIIPGNWGEFYTFNDPIVNASLDNTFGGTWYVLMGSTIAFLVSAVLNAILNDKIGALIKRKDFTEYAIRSYVSTFIAQFADNFIFAIIVGHNFFGWSLLQCITCSLVGCVVELLAEVFLSPIGYKVIIKWDRDKVGVDYILSQESAVA